MNFYEILITSLYILRQLNQRKEFQSSHSYQPVTELTSGPVSYDDFKKLSSEADGQSQSDHTSDQILGDISKRCQLNILSE